VHRGIVKELTFNFDSIDNGFKCRRCGRCCFGDSRSIGIKLFYQEVSQIQEHLSSKSSDCMEEFAWDYATFAGMAEFIGNPEFFKDLSNQIQDFFFAVGRSFDSSNFFVEYYVLKTLQDSGRCIFFNPLASTCFIHEARPMTCRLYPYYATIDLGRGRIKFREYSEECLGLNKEDKSDALKLSGEAIALASTIREHYSTLAEFLGGEESLAIKKLFITGLEYREATKEEAEREYKKMTSSEASHIRDHFLENKLIKASSSYIDRLSGG